MRAPFVARTHEIANGGPKTTHLTRMYDAFGA
jgi:hypothetical protein